MRFWLASAGALAGAAFGVSIVVMMPKPSPYVVGASTLIVTLPIASHVSDDGVPQTICLAPTRLTVVEAHHGDTINLAPYQTLHAGELAQYISDGVSVWHYTPLEVDRPCPDILTYPLWIGPPPQPGKDSLNFISGPPTFTTPVLAASGLHDETGTGALYFAKGSSLLSRSLVNPDAILRLEDVPNLFGINGNRVATTKAIPDESGSGCCIFCCQLHPVICDCPDGKRPCYEEGSFVLCQVPFSFIKSPSRPFQ